MLQDERIEAGEELVDFPLFGEGIALQPLAEAAQMVVERRDLESHLDEAVRSYVQDQSVSDPRRANDCEFLSHSIWAGSKKLFQTGEGG